VKSVVCRMERVSFGAGDVGVTVGVSMKTQHTLHIFTYSIQENQSGLRLQTIGPLDSKNSSQALQENVIGNTHCDELAACKLDGRGASGQAPLWH